MKRLAFLPVMATLLGPVGDARADIRHGIDLFERGHYDEAAVELKAMAEVGVPEAQYLLGVMYLNLMVEPPAPDSALALIEAAAQSGHLPAQTELARMYRAGEGVEQDFTKMMAWYERAAEQGDVGAQLFVADGYGYGYGVEPDLVEAYKWYEIAIQYWGSLAVRARDVLAEKMTDEEIAEAVRRAGAWLASHPRE
ncbi:MAG: tetratricopeptide repeat protein [Paracoccaceae bacterium]